MSRESFLVAPCEPINRMVTALGLPTSGVQSLTLHFEPDCLVKATVVIRQGQIDDFVDVIKHYALVEIANEPYPVVSPELDRWNDESPAV